MEEQKTLLEVLEKSRFSDKIDLGKFSIIPEDIIKKIVIDFLEIDLSGIKEITSEVASILVKARGKLYLNGVVSLEPEIADILSNYPQNILHIHHIRLC
jgi:hypothetical protein